MAEADRARWDGRHALLSDDVPRPPDGLWGGEELLPPSGRALDVACGRGATSVWLAGRGLDVDAVDVSPVGLAAGAATAERAGTGGRLHWWPRDLDAGLPEGCAGPYDVVVCQRFRSPALYPQLVRRLGPGGLLVVTVLSEVGEAPGAWRAPAGELRAAFGHLDVLVDREADGEATLVARVPLGPSSP